MGQERWLSGSEHIALFQKTQVSSQHPCQGYTSSRNSSSRDQTPSWFGFQGHHTHRHTYTQSTYTHTKLKIKPHILLINNLPHQVDVYSENFKRSKCLLCNYIVKSQISLQRKVHTAKDIPCISTYTKFWNWHS